MKKVAVNLLLASLFGMLPQANAAISISCPGNQTLNFASLVIAGPDHNVFQGYITYRQGGQQINAGVLFSQTTRGTCVSTNSKIAVRCGQNTYELQRIGLSGVELDDGYVLNGAGLAMNGSTIPLARYLDGNPGQACSIDGE